MLQRCYLDSGNMPCAGLSVSRDDGVACTSLHRQQMQNPEWRSWALASWVRGVGHGTGQLCTLHSALLRSSSVLRHGSFVMCINS